MKTFKELPNRAINGGIQYWAKFPNGYGASIVKHQYSYGSSSGLWELAVMKTTEDFSGDICYTTDITQDVLGHLDESEVNETLDAISQLAPVELINDNDPEPYPEG